MRDFTQYIGNIVNNGTSIPFEYWSLIILIFVLIYFSSINFSIKLRNNRESLFFKVLISSIFISIYLLGILLIISIVLYVFFYKQFFHHQIIDLDFIILISLESIILCSLVIFLKILFTKNYNKLIRPTISKLEETRSIHYLRLQFQKVKKLAVILLVPFLILLFIGLIKRTASISIVIDNSASTNAYIEYGRSELANELENIHDNSVFCISHFPVLRDESECIRYRAKLKKDINHIIIERNCENLVAINTFINGAQSASNFVHSYKLENSCLGTPLYETLWSNFLFSLKNPSCSEKSVKLLIVLTDGYDNLDSFNNQVDIFKQAELRTGLRMTDYYDQISVINICDNEDGGFFNNLSNEILLDGSNQSSFSESVKLATTAVVKHNWSFIYLISLLTLFSIFGILSSTLKVKPRLNT